MKFLQRSLLLMVAASAMGSTPASLNPALRFQNPPSLPALTPATTPTLRYYLLNLAGCKNCTLHLPDDALHAAILNEEEVELMKKVLVKSIIHHNRKSKKIPELQIRGEKYIVQYLPYLDKKGIKQIWIHGSCEEYRVTAESVKTEIIQGLDGGGCYFSAVLRVGRKKVVEIGTNGLA